VVALAALDRLTCTFLLAAILFVLLMGFASFRKGLLWALRASPRCAPLARGPSLAVVRQLDC
jgi:hypothetical protein